MVKGCTLGKDSANELMGDFTAAFLVRALWIAVENPAPYFSEFGTLNGYGVSKFAASVCQDNWEQTAVLFVSKSFVQPFKNLRDRPCRVSVSQECQHEIRVAEEHCHQHLTAFASLYRVNLNNRSIWIGCGVFKEVLVGSTQMTLLVYPYRWFLPAHFVAYFPGQINVSHRQKSGIHIVVDGSFVQHDFIRIIHADLVNGLPLLNQRGDDSVDPIQLCRCYSKTLSGLAAGRFIFFLSGFCFVKMTLQFTAYALLTAVTNIGRFA